MIFLCEKQKLQDAITIAQKAITGKTPNQILEGICIHAYNNTITLIGSDIDLSIESKITGDVLEEGSVVIDSKIFGDIIRKLPDSEVKIEVLPNDTLQITCEKSEMTVVYMNADEYPSLPDVKNDNEIEVPQSLLKDMIKGTVFAIAQDETRPILQGILFEVKDRKLNLVALDGYRLALKSEYIDSDLETEIVIPGKTLNDVSRILDDSDTNVQITFSENHILFDLGETKIISRLLEGNFVNYKSLLPKEHKILVTVDKLNLQNALERASLMAKEGNSYLIKLAITPDKLLITSNSQLGKAKEEVPVELQGDNIEIAFNSRYLLDVLKNVEDEKVVLQMTSSVSPCVIKAEQSDLYEYLVLPVRLMK
ncbi:DNA polymerase III subunit beta [Clostridium sp. MSJ-8]|uniref:DNA polymerase III subunit beta n=1 Tax=Clostridium sp. MSJ-8 TaxID=2841510 RepID=UPI001C0EBDC5|nr:DNA polymerase III subunit beta [Clostridium sp. MSJ-8]MBU5487462.1 DNA polymerase III subunit beta [Clostridium sp. MSJ-8]